jgi:ABC-type Mn2+/Zn2+ transport system permease subunit
MILTNILLLLIVGIFIGIAASYIGSFMVLKRMSLVGDALSHVALPGIAIAIMFHFSPMFGAFIALFIAVIGVWYLEKTSNIYPEALVGIFFTTALAIGILITPEPDMFEALFGNIEKINNTEGIIAIILSLILIFITFLISKKLLLGTISTELAKSLNISVNKINLIYLILVGIIVSLGIRFVGTLLMGALVIIPAASAKNVSNNINDYYFLSILFGIISSIIGISVSVYYHITTGPIVVLANISIFILTYLIRSILSKNRFIEKY